MMFRIIYLRDGAIVASERFLGSQKEATRAAVLGIAARGAKAAHILVAPRWELVTMVEGRSDVPATTIFVDSP